MPYYRKKSYARKPRYAGRKARPFKKRSYAKKSTFAKKVKAVIHGMAENKIWTIYGANGSIACNTGAGTPFQRSLLPTLALGTNSQNRIGNQVTIVKNTFRYRINLLPYNALTNPVVPQIVKLWVVSLKNKSQVEGLPTNSDYNNFFQVGSTTLNFQGQTLDLMFDINRDLFTLHTTRTHTLGSPITNGLSGGATGTWASSGMPCCSGTINLEKYVKRLKYNDSSTDVTNQSLWLVIQPVSMDGTTGSGVTPAEIHYVHDVQYEDL